MGSEARSYLIFGMILNAFAVVFAWRHQWGWTALYVVGWAAFGFLYVRTTKRGPR